MDANATPRPIEILLVEDNAADVRLTEEAFREGKITNDLHVVTDGEQAMQFLRREPPYTDAPRPDLILLDLNLPKKDGREVLKEIRDDADLQHIPVVVVTASIVQEDMCRAYSLNCNCYVTKPVDRDELVRTVESIDQFWLTVVALP